MFILLKAVLRWIKNGPAVSWAREDIEAVRRNDPAVRSSAEVVFLYPGIHALWNLPPADGG